MESESPSKPPVEFSDQTLSNVLLPMAMHPVYEYTAQSEEPFVFESIALVGEIAKHLPWSKYSTTLNSLMHNLPRYPDQERFLIAMMCKIIDGFHFDVGKESNTPLDQCSGNGNGVWRALTNRLIPKVEAFLVKETVEKNGYKTKTLRASVVLALMKLFQKLPQASFEAQLPRLITVVCNALKHKDSDERDTARATISKMAASLDLKYLPQILSQLTVSLSEGFKLHVRNATLHSILIAVAKVYKRPEVSTIDAAVTLSFDRCVPSIMDLIHQDLFGNANEIKEA